MFARLGDAWEDTCLDEVSGGLPDGGSISFRGVKENHCKLNYAHEDLPLK